MSKKCTPLWREAHFQVKMYKTPGVRTTFGSCDVEKVHAVVARSTCRSQNVQNTRGSDHFWKSRCWKSARRCGAKHISKSKCTKHQGFGPLLEVAMSKKCTLLWREAHVEVKMYKTLGVRTTFGSRDVEKVHVVVARSTFPSQNVQNTILLLLFDCVSFLTAILPGLCVFSDRNPAMEYTEKLPVEIDPEMWFTRGCNWQKCMDRWKAEQGRGREKRKIRREKIREEKESEERRCRCVKR